MVSQTFSLGFQGPNILNPGLPVAFMASEQPAAIPCDETAPGVSESDRDQTLISMLVRPPPPLSSVFSEQAKKLEKRNSCLATANAKDLYDIFYSSGGKGAHETKLSSSPLANGESSSLSRTESSDISSTSALKSSVSPEDLPQDVALATATEISNLENPISKGVESIGKWSIVDQIDPKGRDSTFSFLQPLTRLYQNRPYEMVSPKTDTLAMWTSGSFQNDTDKDRPSEVKIKFDQGEPAPPATDSTSHPSDEHCQTNGSQKLVEINLMDNQDKNQEVYQSEDCRESEGKRNTELKGKVAAEEGANIGLQSIEDSNSNYGNRNTWEGEPKLSTIDKEAEQSSRLMTGHENTSSIVIELSQCLPSKRTKIDSFPSLLQNPKGMPELLLLSPAGSGMCLKRQETWERPEKPEVEAEELQGTHPEGTVKTESEGSESLDTTHVEVERFATLRNLGDTHAEFCNSQIEQTRRSPTALSQKISEENSVSSVVCNPSSPSDVEPVPSFSGFPLESPKILVLNFETEGAHSSSNSRNGRITSNSLETGHPMENVDHDLGGERTHQALDLLAGGMLSEEVKEPSPLQKDLLRMESTTVSPSGHGPSPCLPDLVDFVTRTPGVPKEKPRSPLSEPDDFLKCSSLEMGSPPPEILNVSVSEVAVPQASEDCDNALNLVKPPTSGSPSRGQVVGGSVSSQEMPEQEAAVDVIPDHRKSSVYNCQDYLNG